MPDLGFRVERVGHHWMWELVSDDGRRRLASHEERLMWERLGDIQRVQIEGFCGDVRCACVPGSTIAPFKPDNHFLMPRFQAC